MDTRATVSRRSNSGHRITSGRDQDLLRHHNARKESRFTRRNGKNLARGSAALIGPSGFRSDYVSPYKVQALDRAVAMLHLLNDSDSPLGLSEISFLLQLNKSTAHRILRVLERHGVVARAANRDYTLGLRLVEFGNRAAENYESERLP